MVMEFLSNTGKTQSNICVSVIMLTYKHESFIAEAIESILMQEVDFEIELIIADDCSPDSTKNIVQHYIEKHPKGSWIKYFRHEKNIGMMPNFLFALNETKGEFVALCEGDDSWNDCKKLKKQVDFLINNDEYGLVCGAFTSINQTTGEKLKWFKDLNSENSKYSFGFDITHKIFWNNWCIQTLTVVFRKDLCSVETLLKYDYQYFIDVHLFYHLIRQKKAFYFKEILGTQNVLSDGAYSNKTTLEKRKMLYHARKEISRKHKEDKELKSIFFSVASELFVNKQFLQINKDLRRRTLFYDMFISVQSLKDLKHLIKCLINSKDVSKMFLSNE